MNSSSGNSIERFSVQVAKWMECWVEEQKFDVFNTAEWTSDEEE